MKQCSLCFAVVALCVATAFSGEIKTTGAVAVQITKNSAPGDTSPMSDSWVRAEPKISTANENGLSGLIQLRAEPKMGSASAVALQARQLFFEVPAMGIAKIKAGRWYEVYTPGIYFGRYLFGAAALGNGSMCTNYNILDGARVNISLVKSMKLDLNVAFLPVDMRWNNGYIMGLVSVQPVEPLKCQIGADIQALKNIDSVDAVHRMTGTVQYSFSKDFGIGAEVGVTDLANAGENTWIMGAIDIPTGQVLDQLRFEIEYKKDRIAANPDADLAYILGLMKKAAGLQFNLNIGADPASLASRKASDIGFHFRTTGNF